MPAALTQQPTWPVVQTDAGPVTVAQVGEKASKRLMISRTCGALTSRAASRGTHGKVADETTDVPA